jgi:hypothetical protein
MSEQARFDYLSGLDPEIVWRMSEGNPATNTDITSGGEKIMVIPSELIKKNDTAPQSSTDSQ